MKEVADGEVTLKIFQQDYRISKVSDDLKPGQEVSVFIRPESIELTRPMEVEPLKAVIVEKTFLGEKADYLLDLEGRLLNATSYDPLRHGTFSPRQQVGVRFNPEAITLLRGEKA